MEYLEVGEVDQWAEEVEEVEYLTQAWDCSDHPLDYLVVEVLAVVRRNNLTEVRIDLSIVSNSCTGGFA